MRSQRAPWGSMRLAICPTSLAYPPAPTRSSSFVISIESVHVKQGLDRVHATVCPVLPLMLSGAGHRPLAQSRKLGLRLGYASHDRLNAELLEYEPVAQTCDFIRHPGAGRNDHRHTKALGFQINARWTRL